MSRYDDEVADEDTEICMLVGMGFTSSQAKAALDENGGDVDRATDFLFDTSYKETTKGGEVANKASTLEYSPVSLEARAGSDDNTYSAKKDIKKYKSSSIANRQQSVGQQSEAYATPSLGMLMLSHQDGTHISSMLNTSPDERVPHDASDSIGSSRVYPGAVAMVGNHVIHGERLEEDNTFGSTTRPSETNELSSLPFITAELVDRDEDNAAIEQLRQVLAERDNAAVAEVIDPNVVFGSARDKAICCDRKTKCMVLIGTILVAIGVSLGAVLSNRPSTDGSTDGSTDATPITSEPSSVPSSEPTSAPTSPGLSDLSILLSSVSLDNGSALSTPSTPQNRALSWISDDANQKNYSDEKTIQRYVLATFYYSTNGSDWTDNTRWLSAFDECTGAWFNDAEGPFCSSDGAVIELDMDENNIDGTLPDELALLSNSLQELAMFENQVYGTIPSAAISQLTNLEYLKLAGNELTGSIPTEVGIWSNLKTLSLPMNSLTGTIPSEIVQLTNLESLRLYGNYLTGDFTCPESIADCRVSCKEKHDAACRSL